LLIALVGSGKERHVRLIPTAALDGRDLKWIKVAETRGCHLLCTGSGSVQSTRNSSSPTNRHHYFATAAQKSVLLFQITRSEKRHARIREMAMPGQPQSLKIAQGRLFVGYPSSFRVWDLVDNSQICK
jgi:serine/threonine-protein kinase MRCK